MAMQRQLRVLDSKVTHQAVLKVAFATDDLKMINQHFGSAERFAIYSIDANTTSLLEVAEFGSLSQDGNENKLLEKFVILDGCIAVYSMAVGPSAVRQLMSLGIQPIKLVHPTPISRVLTELQGELKTGPGGWLARAIAQRMGKGEERFEQMADEAWYE